MSWNTRWLVGRPGLLTYYENKPEVNVLRSIALAECQLLSDAGRLLLTLRKSNGVSLAIRLTNYEDFEMWAVCSEMHYLQQVLRDVCCRLSCQAGPDLKASCRLYDLFESVRIFVLAELIKCARMGLNLTCESLWTLIRCCCWSCAVTECLALM